MIDLFVKYEGGVGSQKPMDDNVSEGNYFKCCSKESSKIIIIIIADIEH